MEVTRLMIIDYLNRFKQYTRNVPELYEAVKFAEKVRRENLPVGRYPVGDNYALVQEGATRPFAEGKFEVHKKYLDVQIMIEGFEYMEYADLTDLTADVQYNEQTDVEFLNGKGQPLLIKPGMFYVVYPGDGHKPCCHSTTPLNYKKVVVKIRIDKLIHQVN